MTALFESFNNIPPPFNMIVWIVLISCAAGVISSIAKQTRKFFCHRQEMEFKRELVDRGMNAEEIERVVAVGAGESKDAPEE